MREEGQSTPVIIDSPSSHWLPTEFRCPAASKFKLRARGFLAGTSQFSLRDLTRPHTPRGLEPQLKYQRGKIYCLSALDGRVDN